LVLSMLYKYKVSSLSFSVAIVRSHCNYEKCYIFLHNINRRYCPVSPPHMVKGCRDFWYVGVQVWTHNIPLLSTLCEFCRYILWSRKKKKKIVQMQQLNAPSNDNAVSWRPNCVGTSITLCFPGLISRACFDLKKN
jgi:hypothetical protein